MGLYEVPLSVSLLGFGIGTMLANFHVCCIIIIIIFISYCNGTRFTKAIQIQYVLVLRSVFNMLVKNAGPRWPMCFRCLMFSLSGSCELLFLRCFIASWT